MKITTPTQICDSLAPQLPDGVMAAWVTPEARFEDDPLAAAVYRRRADQGACQHVQHLVNGEQRRAPQLEGDNVAPRMASPFAPL
ncbi:MAG: hypothetical protein HGA45_11815 [Chloroflexales bacterium]|nr:hypothetical protein [Chloroflexales bacterium]